MTRKKVEALPVGQSPMGPGSTLKRIQCIRLTRLGASGLHLIYLLPLSWQQRIGCFKYFQLFQVLHWQSQPAPAPRPTSVYLSLSRSQAACKGVKIVPVEYRESRCGVQTATERAVPVASAAGGGRRWSALISAKTRYPYIMIFETSGMISVFSRHDIRISWYWSPTSSVISCLFYTISAISRYRARQGRVNPRYQARYRIFCRKFVPISGQKTDIAPVKKGVAISWDPISCMISGNL